MWRPSQWSKGPRVWVDGKVRVSELLVGDVVVCDGEVVVADGVVVVSLDVVLGGEVVVVGSTVVVGGGW